MKIRRFKIDKKFICGQEAFLQDPGEIRHIRNVLRMKAGDPVILFDGEGLEYAATIQSVSSAKISLALSSSPEQGAAESPLRLILGLGILKSSKFDWVLQKATELGVTEIVPFYSLRVVPHVEGRKISLRQNRWEKIAAEAAKQCGRAKVPRVHPPLSFAEVLSLETGDATRILLWEEERAGGMQDLRHREGSSFFVLVGPEGGFSAEEASQAQKAGFYSLRLGPRILRAETAALAIIAWLQFSFGDLK